MKTRNISLKLLAMVMALGAVAAIWAVYGVTAGAQGTRVGRISYGMVGITPGQTYDYDVESVSLSGSSARDNLGGSHYRFTAQGSADVLLVIDGAEFDRTVAWTNALTAKGYTYDLWTGAMAQRRRPRYMGPEHTPRPALLWCTMSHVTSRAWRRGWPIWRTPTPRVTAIFARCMRTRTSMASS